MKMFFITCLLAGLPLTMLKAQSISNVSAQQFGNNIEITYDINEINGTYDIAVFHTKDNITFSNPLTHVFGDVGPGLSGSGSKKIIWDVLRETDSFDGTFAFKVIATPKDGSSKTVIEKSTPSGEATMGSFTGSIKEIVVDQDNHVVVTFSLVNKADNENFKVHISKSSMTGHNGTKFHAKTALVNSKEKYGLLNVVLTKDAPVTISLRFDYVDTSFVNIDRLEIIQSVNLGISRSLVFHNLKIPR